MSKKKKKNKKIKTEAPASKAENSFYEDELVREARSNFAPIPHSDSFTEKDFSESVTELDTAEIKQEKADGGEPSKSKKKISKKENIIQLCLLSVCGIAAIVCIVLLIINIRGKIRGAEIYSGTEFNRFTLDSEDSLHFNHPGALLAAGGDSPMLSLYDRIAAGKSPEKELSGEYSQKLDAMKASLTALKAKNPDVYGWIYAENTGIDYPLLRGSDNDYYLDHAYTGESLPIGSIFLDYNCKDLITDNLNTVIYGHNVVTGAMFHDVTKFLDPAFFAANKIYIYTMDGVFIYKPVSVYPTTEKYFYYRMNFTSSADFLSFAAEVISKSSVASGERLNENDTMITLSTCTNGGEGGRYALHAKLIETVK